MTPSRPSAPSTAWWKSATSGAIRASRSKSICCSRWRRSSSTQTKRGRRPVDAQQLRHAEYRALEARGSARSKPPDFARKVRLPQVQLYSMVAVGGVFVAPVPDVQCVIASEDRPFLVSGWRAHGTDSTVARTRKVAYGLGPALDTAACPSVMHASHQPTPYGHAALRRLPRRWRRHHNNSSPSM